MRGWIHKPKHAVSVLQAVEISPPYPPYTYSPAIKNLICKLFLVFFNLSIVRHETQPSGKKETFYNVSNGELSFVEKFILP